MARPKIDDNETKGEKFTRLATSRVSYALDKIRVIGGLADTDRYDYSEEQIRQIRKALEESVDNVMKKFENPKEEIQVFSFS